MVIGQPIHQRMQPRRIFKNFNRADGMHRDIIPGRHDLSVFLFGGIERWGDISLRPQEYRARPPRGGKAAPMRICLGQMAIKRPMRAFIWG